MADSGGLSRRDMALTEKHETLPSRAGARHRLERCFCVSQPTHSSTGALVSADEPAADCSEELATELGLDVDILVDLLGAGWQRVSGRWWHAGDPVQLMVTADELSRQLTLAVPRGEWRGLGELVYVPTRPSHLQLDDPPEVIRTAVADALRSRRSTFRYCRYCRCQVPPEYRDEPDICMGCSERWLGVVH